MPLSQVHAHKASACHTEHATAMLKVVKYMSHMH